MEFRTITQRSGNVKGQILRHAMHKEVLAMAGEHKQLPMGMGDTISFRRYIPWGASASGTEPWNDQNRPAVNVQDHVVSEGQTPDEDVLEAVTIDATIEQYACLYMYTDKVKYLHEDNIPMQQMIQVGERMGLLREMIRYACVKGCLNRFFAGGTNRGTVDETVQLRLLRKVTRNLRQNHTDFVTRLIGDKPVFGTARVSPGWLVFVHTDMESDILDLPNVTAVEEYSNRKPISECEVASTERHKFLISPELKPYPNSGANAAGTGLLSTGTGATKVDVYPMIICGKDAWASLALRGKESIDETHIPNGKKTKSDPLGQRGYVGAAFWDGAFIQNHGWMAMVEAGVTDL